MLCRDKALTILAKYGYNVIRLPRTGIEPLDVIGRDRGSVERLGRLPAIWESAAAEPPPVTAEVATEIKSLATAFLRASVGLRLLEDILAGLGAAVPRVDFAYARKSSLQFTFANIEVAKVDPFDVGRFLGKGDLATSNPWVSRYFFDDDTNAYVITEVLKSDTVTVVATVDNEVGAAVDIEALQKVVGAQVEVRVGAGMQSEVTYRGRRHLSFAFKAFEIAFDFDLKGAGEWRIRGTKPDGKVYLDDASEAAEAPLLAERDGSVGRINLK